ncbi:MAG: PhnD/SsuA/transferrin family substrate-binding protein [Prochloraceae cyanobacterium]|nr:PhnD/SsuA/transferrin family substrate-binding protein [Prochloraceae cyanobacterium]
MKRRNFIGYSLLFLAGCSAATKNYDNSAIAEPEKLRFAVTDVRGLERLQQEYETFRNGLQEVLEKPIEFFPVNNFIDAASALQLDRVDLVLAGPSEYVIVNARTNAIPIVALTRPRYRSVIAVRANSGIKSLAQLKGKTIAVSNLGSTASHLGSIDLLIEAGLNPQSDLKVLILEDSSHGKKGLEALKNREVDAWGVVIYRYEKYLQDRGLSQNDFPAIAKGKLLPSDVFIASSQLALQFVEKMRSRMLENQDKLMEGIIAAESKFKGGALIPANDSDYNMIRQVYAEIGQGDFLK